MVRMKLCLALAINSIVSGTAGYLLVTGCAAQAAQLPTVDQQAAVYDERTEGQVCINQNKTKGKDAIDACRATVKAKYDAKQNALLDGGGL